jgi:hypothetical protein
MMAEPSTAQEKRERIAGVQQAAGLVRERAAIQARLDHYEQLRDAAEQARADHSAELQRIRNQQATIRMAVAARGTTSGPDGRPQSGPTGAERAEYDRLEAAEAEEERRYELWVADARLPESDGVLDRSWSRRDPIAIAIRIDRLRVQHGVLGARLDQLGLSDGERVQAGLPSPAFVEHREKVEALRARLG